MKNTEILVIGSGVIGSSIAYHLAQQGRQVLVVERSEVAVEPAASWASAGGVRRQGRHPAEARLASEAIERWKTLEEELGVEIGYRRGGNLLVTESDEEAESLVGFVRDQQEMGFVDVRLVDKQEVRMLVPGISEKVVEGSYSPSDGQADPTLTTRAFANAAERYGATYWKGTACLALVKQGQRVVGAQTERGEVRAQVVVLAAGAWSNELLSTIGISLPIRMYALQMVLSTPASINVLQPVLSAVNRSLSLKQLNSGAFLIGGGWLGEPTADGRFYTMRPENVRGNWETACEILPAVDQQRIEQSWCGLEAKSFDDTPFIGEMPGVEGLTVAAGFSGHGFALAPALGRAVADQIEGRPAPELEGLSPNRIANFPFEEVEAFILRRKR